MDLVRIGAGAVAATDCDIFGRMRPDIFMGRVSDGVPTLGMALREMGAVPPSESGARVGGAVLEYRVAYHAWPRAGDRFVIRSGLAAVGDRTQRLVHWMLDPETGRPWATAEAIAIALDLETRKIIPISVGDQVRLSGRVTPGLAL
jgi:acyl-CoA thioester hydrolase